MKKHKPKIQTIYVRLFLISCVLVLIIGYCAFQLYQADPQPDAQCMPWLEVSSKPLQKQATAMDYYQQGNTEYDKGNCRQAIANYTQSILLNPFYAKSYNNRGYTYMHLQEFEKALSDFDMAIQLNPQYVNALMNRGDLYNFYGGGELINRKKAARDYEKVISIDSHNMKAQLGLFLARHNSWRGLLNEIKMFLL